MSDMKPMGLGESLVQSPREFRPLWHAYAALQNAIAASGRGIEVTQEECEEFIQRELGDTTYYDVVDKLGVLSRKLISEIQEKEHANQRLRVFEVWYGNERNPKRERVEAATMMDVLKKFEAEGKDVIKVERLALGYTVNY